jgi:hypothetical protein
MKKSAKLPDFESSEELTANLLTKPAVVPKFILFGLEFGELADLPSHW